MVGTVVVIAGWLAGWWLLWRIPTVGGPARQPGGGAPAGERSRARHDGLAAADVTVVIPARNEAHSLPRLLESLRAQTSPPRRIVVVDDASEDGTGATARSFPGVTVIDGAPLPPGWTGKTWACHQGVQAADTERIVFLDADVVLAPDGLAAVVDELDRRGGLVSVQPFHRTERPYEQLSAVFNVVAMMGVGAASPGRDGRAAAAFGPCLACRRADYDAVGGHAAVRGEIVEDVALASRFAGAGLPVHALGGGDRLAFRMYPDGVRQLVEGWSKNFASGAGATSRLRLALVVLWVVALLSAVRMLVDGLLGAGPGTVALGGSLTAASVVQQRVMLRQVGTFGWPSAVGYPLMLGVFLAVFARSLWLTAVRREVVWRGRAIPLTPARDSRAHGPVTPEPLGAPAAGAHE